MLDSTEQSDLISKLLAEKKIARELQEKRHENWTDNYELYRNKVRINRLTQRQAVNIPLMKETVKTLLSKIDDPPTVDWEELSGDEQKEIVFQEMWNDDSERLNFEGIDVQDKKNVLLYGRGIKKLNWGEEGMEVTALDPYDFLVDPLTNPLDVETSRFVVHQNIFRRLRDILADERYDEEAKRRLKGYLSTKQGVIQGEQNKEEFEKKVERMRAMGVTDVDFDLYGAGDVVVNLTEHGSEVWSASKKAFERRIIVYAEDTVELLNDSLKNLMGTDTWPFITWGEDMEIIDFWTDGVADLVRAPNKVLNVWFSQLVENRTIRNFQMHWYDATKQGYTPQTYEPGPGRMLPAPGNPRETIMPVDIQGLDETLTAIDFIIKMVERGSSATAMEKGVSERKQITLGEVNTLVGKAMERTVAMAKFYRRSWYELALKWHALMEANMSKPKTLYKTAGSGKVYPKIVYPSDWKSKAGYRPIVRSTSEQEEEKTKAIQRFMFIRGMFPNNPALNRIIQQRSLELVDLTPAEMRTVEESEKQVQKQQEQLAQQQAAAGQAGVTPQGMQPKEQQTLQQVQQQVGQLEQLQQNA